MRKKHGSVPKIHTCSGPDSHNKQKHWHSKCHYKRNSGSVPAGMDNLHAREARGATSSRRITSKRGSPQSALAGPHSCPRHASEEEDGMLHPSWTATARLPQHGWRTSPPQNWRMVSTTRSWKRRWSADPRGGGGGRAPAQPGPRPSEDDDDQLGAGPRSQLSLLLPIQGLVVTVLGDPRQGGAAGLADENP
jgi:hypothetical protein